MLHTRSPRSARQARVITAGPPGGMAAAVGAILASYGARASPSVVNQKAARRGRWNTCALAGGEAAGLIGRFTDPETVRPISPKADEVFGGRR